MPGKALTVEEKAAKFDAMMAKREGRKGQSSARRAAVKKLIATHQADFDKFLIAAGGKPSAKKD